ncbi:MAG: hypothetical protein CL802_13645 [Citromicrobium sp.]|nr:hypothetical protein [Citromicrobium sp.]
MPRTSTTAHATPATESDRQARAAFRDYTLYYQDNLITAALPIDMSPRTFERIFAGKRDVPPGVAREMAAKIRTDVIEARDPARLEGWATALETWARDCEARNG